MLLPKRIALLWVSTSLLVGTGCVHMNIPSVRYGEDPTPLAATSHGEPAGLHCVDAGRCGRFPGDHPPEGLSAGGVEGAPSPPPPEVPWPRFHPLPTRPVYGP